MWTGRCACLNESHGEDDMENALKVYGTLQRQISKGALDARQARWECGRRLLEERGDKKRHHKGRLEHICHACQVSKVEAFQTGLSRRMRLAKTYPTTADVAA